MAGTSLLALIDDIATLLDDVLIMTKVAAKKTAGVLGDDLALNAEQVSGVRAERELPVVWAVAKGSALNKLILVPVALLLSYFFPWLIMPLMVVGGSYLCFEGFEKIAEKYLHADETIAAHEEKLKALEDPALDLVVFEKEKIKGAIRTDFILSAEIIVIALGTVKDQAFISQVMVVILIASLMTVGVYTLVAAIVKLDDLGLYLIKQNKIVSDDPRELRIQENSIRLSLGRGILWVAPWLMKTLSVVGTIAMFLVGGGILVHAAPFLESALHAVQQFVEHVPLVGWLLVSLLPILINGAIGFMVGGILVGVLHKIKAMRAS